MTFSSGLCYPITPTSEPIDYYSLDQHVFLIVQRKASRGKGSGEGLCQQIKDTSRVLFLNKSQSTCSVELPLLGFLATCPQSLKKNRLKTSTDKMIGLQMS